MSNNQYRPRLNDADRAKLAQIRGVDASVIGKRPRLSKSEFDAIRTPVKEDPIISKIRDTFSDKELRILSEVKRPHVVLDNISFSGKKFKIGVIGDTHFGSIYTEPDKTIAAFREFEKQGCTMILHTGDVTEGMSNRPDHIFQCSHIGYHAQREHAIDVLSKTKLPIYAIDGNHDRWFAKINGALIVKDICDRLPHCHFIGHDEGDLDIGGVKVRLWHGEDSSSYAVSYRIQKLVESFTGGDKPAVLFCGHTHKQGYFFDRNIHCVSTGALQSQSKWMRSKRLASHVGFHIVEMVTDNKEVKSFSVKFYPYYK